jgi:hypothetical protein
METCTQLSFLTRIDARKLDLAKSCSCFYGNSERLLRSTVIKSSPDISTTIKDPKCLVRLQIRPNYNTYGYPQESIMKLNMP